MEKLFTEKDYSDMAVKANAEKKKLVVVQKEVEYQVEVPEYEKKTIEVSETATDDDKTYLATYINFLSFCVHVCSSL